MAVGRTPGSILDRIDHHQACPTPARFHDERPEMNVGAEDVCAPGDDELRVRELLGLGAQLGALTEHKRRAARSRTNGAIEPRRAEPVEEAAVHAGTI